MFKFDDNVGPWKKLSVLLTPTEPTKINADITIPPRPCVTVKGVSDNIEKLKKFSIRNDDIWIVTFPKCGTTWTQEMCWLILNNFDYKTAKTVSIAERSPFWEFSTMAPKFPFNTLDFVEKLKSPRPIKTHIQLALLPNEMWIKKPKIIYVARDPRDVAISYYHHYVHIGNYKGTKEEFLDSFIKDIIVPAPFFGHVLEFWKLRHLPNVLFLTYEEMKKDLGSVIRKTATFLNKSITEEQIAELVEHLSFENMKNNPMVNHELEIKSVVNRVPDNFRFIRRGEMGAYKDELPSNYNAIFENWIKKNTEGTDFNLYNIYKRKI